jgi:hypothetical protein
VAQFEILKSCQSLCGQARRAGAESLLADHVWSLDELIALLD